LKKTKFDKRVSAYADGALEGTRRTRLERELDRDPALRETLERTQSLGRLVRDAWTDGPPAPPTDFLIASLRSQLTAIDRERRARPAWQQALEHARVKLGHWFGPVPIATSAAAAFLLALVLLPQTTGQVEGLGAALTPATAVPRSPVPPYSAPPMSRLPRRDGSFSHADFSTDGRGAIYDFSPTERPAMIFREKDGSTMLWLLDDDGLSWWRDSMDRWG
jgi:anti-sigma factor RsiW